ncbi:hypothetical protein [Vitiosangium sp. GDMCC 1.1324]|uniref:hypothetical protein n=1 Tax=Vitiosangium sp. (strain GDMCC 1.1324) TaxID=2138576 RepID=UPI0011B39EEC|nr:hypothetical protein [Vitiosangium sp. GDMCC 1.1324]
MATLFLLTVGLSGCGAPEARDEPEAVPQAPSLSAPLAADCTDPSCPSLIYRTYVPLLRNTQGTGTGLPGAGWYTPLVIQNTDTVNSALVLLEAVPMAGIGTSRSTTAQAAIPPGGSVVFRPDNPTGLPGVVGIPAVATGNFQGSMVIHSDRHIAVTATLSNAPISSTLGTAGGRAKGAFSATRDEDFEGPVEVNYAPVKSGFFGRATRLFLQSTNRDVNTTVTATLRRELDGQDFTVSLTLAPLASAVLDPTDFRRNGIPFPTACNPIPSEARACLAALHLTSSDRLGAVAVEVPTQETVPSVVMMNRLSSGELDYWKLACPTVKKQFPAGSGISTAIALMNVAPVPQTVDARLEGTLEPVTPATGHEYWQVFTDVPSLRSVVASSFQDSLGLLPDATVSSATLTAQSGGDLVAAAVEEGGGRLASYSCIPVTRGRHHVAIPAAKFEFPSRTDAFAANTGITVQSVGPAPTSVTMTYRCRTASSGTFTPYVVQRPIGPYESRVFSPFNITTIPSGSLCTVLIDSSSENIVATANESSESLPSSTQDSASFEGVWMNN